MATGTAQNKIMSDGISMSDGMENVTFLATCINHEFFRFDNKVMIGISVIDNPKEFSCITYVAILEILIKIPSDMVDSVRHDQRISFYNLNILV